MSHGLSYGQFGPPTISFPSSELPAHVNTTEKGKRRKPPVNLEECALMEMVQHQCDVKNRNTKQAYVECKPLLRLFRRCAGDLIVETTEWEWIKEG